MDSESFRKDALEQLNVLQGKVLGNGRRQTDKSLGIQVCRLTFLSRNEAISPKFFGCCMNLQEREREG